MYYTDEELDDYFDTTSDYRLGTLNIITEEKDSAPNIPVYGYKFVLTD